MITHEKALQLIKEHNMPERILRHSLVVNKIAVALAKQLRSKGIDVDVHLVDMASLLHDIAKVYDIQDKKHHKHGDRAYEILKDISPEVASAAKKHMLGAVEDLKTWEEKIIYYADKRVNDDKIVTLEERFRYLRRRYPKVKKLINACEPKLKELEKELISIIGDDGFQKLYKLSK